MIVQHVRRATATSFTPNLLSVLLRPSLGQRMKRSHYLEHITRSRLITVGPTFSATGPGFESSYRYHSHKAIIRMKLGAVTLPHPFPPQQLAIGWQSSGSRRTRAPRRGDARNCHVASFGAACVRFRAVAGQREDRVIIVAQQILPVARPIALLVRRPGSRRRALGRRWDTVPGQCRSGSCSGPSGSSLAANPQPPNFSDTASTISFGPGRRST
jgi:hypothetical protein